MSADPEATAKADSPDPVTTVIESGPALFAEAKAGYKTTEFWLTIVAALITVLGVVPVPDHYKAPILAVLTAAYAFARGQAKRGIPAPVTAPGA